MKNVFSIVEDLLRAETSSLIELANIAGLDPKVMYAGADFRGVKLSSQDSELVRNCGGLVDQPAGEAAQQDKDEKTDPNLTDSPAIRKISEIRWRLFEKYFRSYSFLGLEHPLATYISNLFSIENSISELRKLEQSFVQLVITEAHKYWPEFRNTEARVKFVSVICEARFAFRLQELGVLGKYIPEVLFGDRFLRVFNLNLCNSRFLRQVIDANSERRAQGKESFISAIVHELAVIPADLSTHLIRQDVSIVLIARILSKTGGMDLIEARKEIAEACIARARTNLDVTQMVAALSKAPLVRRHLLFLGIRSRNLDVAVASVKEAHALDLDIRNLEFGEILFGFDYFEAKFDFAVRVKKYLPKSSLRILVDELLLFAQRSDQKEMVQRSFSD